MNIPKSAQKFMAAEIADDKKWRARQLREFGKHLMHRIEFCHDMVTDDIQALMTRPKMKKYRSIMVTVQIELGNGFKYGRTISAVEMPKRFQKEIDAAIAAAGKRRMKKMVTP